MPVNSEPRDIRLTLPATNPAKRELYIEYNDVDRLPQVLDPSQGELVLPLVRPSTKVLAFIVDTFDGDPVKKTTVLYPAPGVHDDSREVGHEEV